MKKSARKMPIIGLTGGIGMGKSTAALILREMGFPVYEADKGIHSLLRKNGKAIKPVAKLFPDAVTRGAIDRKKLGSLAFDNASALRKLEKILHPLVREIESTEIEKAWRKKSQAIVLEIPLLFETGAEKRCDFVICVTATKSIQKARVMQRPGMTAARLRAILARQMPDALKRKKADFIIDTGGTMAATRRQVQAALSTILKD